MQNNRHLTIQDYFRQADATGRPSPLRRLFKGAAQSDPNGFSRALKAVQDADNYGLKGRSIQDYMKTPVHAQKWIRTPLAADISATARRSTSSKSPATVDTLPTPTRVRRVTPDLPNAAQRIDTSVNRAAEKYDLDSDLIHAVIRAESNYRVRAVSSAGAQGLMQLMPGTAEEMGVRNPFNIEQNIDGGAKYLRNMLTRFNGDLKLALSAYNAGPGNVAKYNGQVPFAETRSYVARVLRYTGQSSGNTIKPL